MKVDLLIQNGWVYRTYRQCFEKADIAVAGEKFYDVSPASCYEADHVVDAKDNYIIPGLIDIHMHMESSMIGPAEFSRAVLPWGVTTVVADPHEIANVFGMEGISRFMEVKTDLDIYYAIPSSVPAAGEAYETTGGVVGEKEVLKLLEDDRVICLGEVMNHRDLISPEDTKIKRLIQLCQTASRDIKIEGHCPSLTGRDLAAFIRAGVDADHTQQTPESVLEKTDMGMFLELQGKSLTHDVVSAVVSHELYENVALVTDDVMPDHLVTGHLNRILRLAVEQGMPAEKAVYCSTLTPARRMGLNDRGMIAPGKLADFIILEDLLQFNPLAVYKKGKLYESPSKQDKTRYPDEFYQSVKCRIALESDFKLNRCKIKDGEAVVSVMQVQEYGTRICHVKRRIAVKDHCLCWQEAGLCLAVVYERYGKNGNVSYGLVENGLKLPGAVATTWSHDSHNLLVLGNSPKDMLLAQNRVVHMQGGYVTAREGEITAFVNLPVGGILSDEGLYKLSKSLGEVRGEIEDMGYKNSNVIMSISTLTLLVSPELKLSDKGLFDTKDRQGISLVEKYEYEKGKG